ncbi:hypothetical protein CW304_16080 [Bacillus sp. UFRGS-B20]|nr:hypothetical protein CW304_16080 [Bacillus sp. UFRGS-B20]
MVRTIFCKWRIFCTINHRKITTRLFFCNSLNRRPVLFDHHINQMPAFFFHYLSTFMLVTVNWSALVKDFKTPW